MSIDFWLITFARVLGHIFLHMRSHNSTSNQFSAIITVTNDPDLLCNIQMYAILQRCVRHVAVKSLRMCNVSYLSGWKMEILIQPLECIMSVSYISTYEGINRSCLWVSLFVSVCVCVFVGLLPR